MWFLWLVIGFLVGVVVGWLLLDAERARQESHEKKTVMDYEADLQERSVLLAECEGRIELLIRSRAELQGRVAELGVRLDSVAAALDSVSQMARGAGCNAGAEPPLLQGVNATVEPEGDRVVAVYQPRR